MHRMELLKRRLEKNKEVSEKSSDFHTPYFEVTLKEAGEALPEKKKELQTVLQEIDTQGLENFAVFQSKAFPGVAFSYTKLTVTPEIIRDLSTTSLSGEADPSIRTPDDAAATISEENTEGVEEGKSARRHDYFLFTAFAPPPDGHALTVQDMAVDRYIRLLPRVANAMSRGEPIPEVNVYLLGAPTGFGGSVTPEWIENIKKEGPDGYGKLYAEFVALHEPKGTEEAPHIVFQGVSKGAVIAERASRCLPEELQEHTQRLLDNPAGHHGDKKLFRWVKGAQAAVGLGAETMARMLLDDTMKGLMEKGKTLIDRLSEKTGILKDNETQTKLKREAAIAEGIMLVKGSSLDTETTRSFIRRGIYDPLTFSLKNLMNIRREQRDGVPVPFFGKGKTTEVPFKGHHFFLYDRYHRWGTIFDFVKNTKNTLRDSI